MGLFLLCLIVVDHYFVGCVCLALDLVLYIFALVLLLYLCGEVSRLPELVLGDESAVLG